MPVPSTSRPRPARRPLWARRVTLAVALTCAAPAGAHDFWVRPDAFWTAAGATTPLTLQVGHGPYRQRSPIPLARITRFTATGPEGAVTDLRAHLHPGGATQDGDLRLAVSGVHVLVLQTDDRAESHLPALRYNDYLKAEGLTPALALRARTHRADMDGSENYSRQAKALVQVGPAGGSQAQVSKPVGLTLEIVPERSPYAAPRSASLPVRVVFEGRPLAGALVKLTDLAHDAAPVETHLTDGTGHATFVMPARGQWLLNVIWTKPQPKTRETDFETVFSSLSFGFPP
ncbi:MAG: sodium:proton antiporter [Phenylobacterium sp.]|nr:sodium:proton antiporter [Phenylobacterium sp.]